MADFVRTSAGFILHRQNFEAMRRLDPRSWMLQDPRPVEPAEMFGESTLEEIARPDARANGTVER